MRPLELLLLINGMLYLLWLSFGTAFHGSVFEWLPFLGTLLAIAQILFERYRWQLIPAYGLTLLMLGSFPWVYTHEFRIRLTYLVLIWLVAGVLVFASGILAGTLYPVFAFVPLTGSFRVGTVAMHLTDTERTDPYVPGTRGHRELMVQCWYPADTGKENVRAHYRDGRRNDWRSSNLSLVKTRSYLNAPFRQPSGRLPVLLFTGPNNRFQNTFQTEELASHGYVVIALDHPYASDSVRFPDGRIISKRKENMFLDFRTEATFQGSTEEVSGDLEVRVADMEFVIGCLRKWDECDSTNPLSGKIDTSRIGVLGHSFGGAVAAEVCVRNPEIQAGINMDGWMFGRARTEGVSQPFFFMVDCTPRPTEADVHSSNGAERRNAQRTLEGYEEVDRSLNAHGGYFLQTPGLAHMNYSDYPLFSQVRARTGGGDINLRRAHSMVNALSVAFFNTYLFDGPEEMLSSIAAQYPEAYFSKFAPISGQTRLSLREVVARR